MGLLRSGDGTLSRGFSPVALSFYSLLLLLSLLHAVKHRRVASRGWMLNRVLLLLVALYTVTASLEVATAYGRTRGALGATRIVGCIAESLFLFIIMAIACGWRITRETLGEYQSTVLTASLVYLASSLVVQALSTFEVGSSAGALALLAVSLLLRLASLLFAWGFVFVAISDERAVMEQRAARLRFLANAFRLDDEAEEGRVAQPRSLRVSSHIIAQSADASDDGVFGSDAAKAALLDGFRAAVSFYVLTTACAVLVSLLSSGWFTLMNPFEWIIQAVFIASLMYIFRPRDDNPYLLLVGDNRFDVASRASDWRQAAPAPPSSSRGRVPPAAPVPMPPAPPPPTTMEKRQATMPPPPPPPPPPPVTPSPSEAPSFAPGTRGARLASFVKQTEDMPFRTADGRPPMQ
jgi:hypothetical protein